MKIVIVNAYGRTNRGDSVLLDECINEINNTYSNCSISGVVFEGIDDINQIHPKIEWSERIGNTKYKGNFQYLLTLYYLFISYLIVKFKVKFLKLLLPNEQYETVKNILNADMIISAPGGYIHDTNFAYYIALFHIYLGILLKKEIVLAPQSIGPIKSNIARKIAKYIFNKINFICVREKYSYDFLITELSLNKNTVYHCGDSAFWNEDILNNNLETKRILKDEIGIDLNKPILGLTVIDWRFPHKQNVKELKKEYILKIIKLCEYMHNRYDLQILIYNQVSDDLEIANLIEKECNVKIFVDNISREPNILRMLIQEAKVFVGTRFHSCIFAMIANIPTIAISYLPKTEYIMMDLDLKENVIDINSIELELFFEKVEYNWNNTLESKLKLKNALIHYRQKFPRLSDVLAKVPV